MSTSPSCWMTPDWSSSCGAWKPALQTFLANWLAQQWPPQEAAMLDGRAAALDRCALQFQPE